MKYKKIVFILVEMIIPL